MYKKAIDLLLSMNKCEKAELAVELAKHHPSIFIKLALGEEKKEDKLDEELISILEHINAGRRVEGIHSMKAYFQFGLKEAYDVEKALRGEVAFLSESQKSAVKKLKDASKML